MNRLLLSETPTVAKVRNNRSKRVLQVLQVSASDKGLLVSPNLMSGKDEKPEITQRKTVAFQDGLLSKENTPVVPTVRRSKRKNAATQEQTKKATSKEGTETKVSSNKVSKVTNTASQNQVKKATSTEETENKASSNKVSKVKKSKKTSSKKNKEQASDLKQSKMDSFIASSSTSNTISETKLENDGISLDNDALLQESKSCTETAVSPVKLMSSETSMENFKDSGIVVSPNMLTSDNPPESYWKLIAEERRIALEEALRENEQLYDQVQVLETENSQLKDCLKEAETLAEVLRQTLE